MKIPTEDLHFTWVLYLCHFKVRPYLAIASTYVQVMLGYKRIQRVQTTAMKTQQHLSNRPQQTDSCNHDKVVTQINLIRSCVSRVGLTQSV